ncbi:cadmium resistance protein CadD (predicted permease) [Roseiarcus fermentans]|uniref:Cadmium resistance protein CadD (Predicted permease) n=1 Tax=Roseiarcus fermentans TaxID=1473586 RepID=A0A366FLM3_9HYPH|nr:cadmium resistance transporter [Roseiarcus fermentans]RBP15487.1 cadmium resistance protein CadD (predicted permease) [Roseiarcus fermentans]
METFPGPGPIVEAIGVAGLVAASYASTNLDNFVVVSAYSAKSGYRPVYVKLTFALVCLTVVCVSLALARAADALIADQLRYLGFIPIGIGLWQLGALVFAGRGAAERPADDEPARVGWALYLGFGLSLLANSSDSVIVLAPIFADLRLAFVVVCAVAALSVAIAMSSLATVIATNPLLRAKLEKIADRALPFLLIAIGLMIVLDKPADLFVP